MREDREREDIHTETDRQGGRREQGQTGREEGVNRDRQAGRKVCTETDRKGGRRE